MRICRKEKSNITMDKKVSIYILNYNGKDLLAEYLPSVVEAVKYDGNGHEIVVVDNLSTDDSVEFVERNFPQVKVRKMETNRLLFSYNQVVKECKNDYVILLNTDIKIVEPDFVRPLLRHFSDPDVFAVVPKVLSDNPSEEYLYRCPGVFSRGLLWTGRWEKFPGKGFTLFAHGGAAAYNRNKFLELGGFDDIYCPGYDEDQDISYLAWMRGWKIIFEPESVVFHRGGATFKRTYKDNMMQQHKEKVAMVFALKNISDRRMLAEFFFWSLLRFFKYLSNSDMSRVKAYKDVIAMTSRILRSRRKMKMSRRISDRSILEIIKRNRTQSSKSTRISKR